MAVNVHTKSVCKVAQTLWREKEMKIFAVTALLIGIGAVPAFAQNYDFTYTGSGVSATGTLTGTEIGNTGSYNITGGTISTFTPNGDFSGTIDSNPADLSAVGGDDVLYVNPQKNGFYLGQSPNYGLLFSMSYGGDNLIWAGNNGGGGAGYSIWYYDDYDIAYPGTFTVTSAVPDGGTTLLLLGLAVAGLAGLRRKLSM
jgi:hypothetical protein